MQARDCVTSCCVQVSLWLYVVCRFESVWLHIVLNISVYLQSDHKHKPSGAKIPHTQTAREDGCLPLQLSRAPHTSHFWAGRSPIRLITAIWFWVWRGFPPMLHLLVWTPAKFVSARRRCVLRFVFLFYWKRNLPSPSTLVAPASRQTSLPVVTVPSTPTSSLPKTPSAAYPVWPTSRTCPTWPTSTGTPSWRRALLLASSQT